MADPGQSGRLRPSDVAWEQFHDPHGRPTSPVRVLHVADPYTLEVDFPPDFYAGDHWHPGDTIYIITKGQMRIGAEGIFEPGDIRWVRAGHVYGPEEAGPDGVTFFLVSLGGPLDLNWADIEDVPEDLKQRLDLLTDVWGRVTFDNVISTHEDGLEVKILSAENPHLRWERAAPGYKADGGAPEKANLTLILAGSLEVDGEGTYKSHDFRWTRDNSNSPAETAGEEGFTRIVIDLATNLRPN